MHFALFGQCQLVKVVIVGHGVLQVLKLFFFKVERVQGLIDSEVVIGLDRLQEWFDEPKETSISENADGLGEIDYGSDIDQKVVELLWVFSKVE